MFKRLILTGLAAVGAAAKQLENGDFSGKEIAPSNFTLPESEYHIETMALSKHQVELDFSTPELPFETTGQEVQSFWQSAVEFVSNLPTTMYKTVFHEKAKAEAVQTILDSNFKDRIFDFVEFLEANNIEYDRKYILRSDIIKNGFGRMYETILDLMTNGITVNKGEEGSIKIMLTSDEIIEIYNSIETTESNHASTTNADQLKAYQLYSRLGDLIQGKILDVVKDEYFTEKKNDFVEYQTASYSLVQSALSLPLSNLNAGLEMCINMMKSGLDGIFSVFTLSEQTLSDDQKKDPEYQAIAKQLYSLGIFAPFGNIELAKELLESARFAVSVGMKPSWCIVDATADDTYIDGFSDSLTGVLICDDTGSDLEFHGFKNSHAIFYHETTHNVRQIVGALDIDPSLSSGYENEQMIYKNLRDVLKDHDDIISAIESQISDYALTDYEEYIAEFSALVLCALEKKKDPFDYITDFRLWRLYYEFGGPDFAPIINERNKGLLVRDMLNDPAGDMVSGYPSKFGIDVSQIAEQHVTVEGTIAIGVKSDVEIDEQTILPPPPLGYCYEVKDQKLKLKDLKSEIYYDPTFCSLTNGPLTLMKTNPELVRHFELL